MGRDRKSLKTLVQSYIFELLLKDEDLQNDKTSYKAQKQKKKHSVDSPNRGMEYSNVMTFDTNISRIHGFTVYFSLSQYLFFGCNEVTELHTNPS